MKMNTASGLVFDLTDRESFCQIPVIKEQIEKEYGEYGPFAFVLIG